MGKFFHIATVLSAVSGVLASVTPLPSSSYRPHANLSRSECQTPTTCVYPSSSFVPETLTLTVYPLPKVTDVSSVNGSDTATVSTTCDEIQPPTVTTSIDYSVAPTMSQSGGAMSLSSLSSIAPSGSSSAVDGVATAGHISTVDALSVFSTTYDAAASIDNTPASQEFDATATSMITITSTPTITITPTSTIKITSTSTVVVATVTIDLPGTGESVSSENTAPCCVSSTKTTDDPFPEPFATMPPNVPPYVQQTTDSPQLVTSMPSDISSNEKNPPKQIADVTLDVPKAFIEIFSTITRVVTVFPSSCEATSGNPTDLAETQISTTSSEAGSTLSISDASTELVATGALPAASTAVIVGPVPTIYSHKPLYQNLNTLLTQSSGNGAVTDTTPTFSGIIASASAATGSAGRVNKGYASLVIGLFIPVVLLLAV